jgi:ribosomal protein S18 acetylase RimI-like enzyme
MHPNIRQFTIEDYDRVIELWRAAGLPIRPQGRDSKEKIREQIKNGVTFLLVAEMDDIIVGTALGTHDGRKGWINRLAVDTNYRRRKIASQMVKELENIFEKIGLEVTACLIEEDNKISMELFKEMGYAEWSGKYFSRKKRQEA